MSRARILASQLRGLFEHTRLERELDEEIRFHLEMQVDENLRAGMSPEEALYAARRGFGAIEPMKESYREGRSFPLAETTAQDIRYALRTLRRSPGFTITAALVLALAIGANTAMFSVLYAVLLKPLPYRSPEQLAMLWTENSAQNIREGRPAYWNAEQWRSQSRSFADMAFFDGVSATLTSAEGAEKISVLRHSPNLFSLLGVQPLLGRTFSDEEAEQRQRVALISHQFWQSRFGGSPDALGARVGIDGASSQIIGILPADFQFDEADVWEPHTMYANWAEIRQARGSGFWSVIGRLRPKVSAEQAQAEMSTIARRLEEELPGARGGGVSVVPLSVQITGRKARLALWMLAGAVFLVLLIAATNVASLCLARAASREREFAVRTALGASRARIVRQVLAEGVTLAVLSGLAGLLIAYRGICLLLAFKPVELARLNEVSVDLRVLAAAMALCLLTGILVGLAPAIFMTRRDLRPSVQGGGAATRRTRGVLVVTEFALAVVLLVGAGLLVRSLRSVENVELGFRPERVLSMQLSTSAYSASAQRTGFYSRVLEEVEALPGVESAGMTSELFIGGTPERAIRIEGDARVSTEYLRFRSDEVSPGFFSTLGTPLLRGRLFSAADGPNSPPVVIINEAMGRRLWPGQDPVGKRFKPVGGEAGGPWFTVAGVVGDMRRQGLEQEPIPQMFEPLTQSPPRLAILLVRTSVDNPLKMAAAVQDAMRRVDRNVPQYGITTLEIQLGEFLAERRFQTSLLTGFSGIALLMAVIGIYGLIQYSVAMRTREIGIRIAVGAQAGQVFRMVLREGLALSLVGLTIGMVGALWLGRAASGLLYGVTARDPATFLSVSLLLTAAAAAACYFPARRAMQVEPLAALRQE